ncbi:S8 family serine peptidase [Actibacterium sp. 188UL27-1]|uniref:S8 family serine peptidase n=1 Tax=Actibacterium sp. 188UL27-1 TaxID=2786961 RepID=UPI00195842C4|nr:S8 family serine peptidase [Actibacterium sp. 188UL27-1]MBM7067391.1 hypothetical protein [Actibacterium sp. 188UL27-1]
MQKWTKRKTAFKGTATDIVEPYEDWDYATRPPMADAATLWQPVYIRLCPDGSGAFTPAALALLDHMAKGVGQTVAMAGDAVRRLKTVIAREAADTSAAPYDHLFVYRPEMDSYTPLSLPGDAPVYEVIHVGIAVPGSDVSAQAGALPEASAHPVADAPVVTAVIDDAIGIANERFRADRTTTRIQKYWLQTLEEVNTSAPGAGVMLGREYDAAQINNMLAASPTEDAFYRALRPVRIDGDQPVMRRGYRRPFAMMQTHGTHVMDLAGGAPCDTLNAQDHPLVAVELPPLATIETTGGRLDTYILQALQRILDWVDHWPGANGPIRVPVVINLSYGVTAGPKNGSGFLEREMARLIDARSAEGVPTKVVLPSGNAFRAQLTGAFRVRGGKAKGFDWQVQAGDQSISYLELRVPKGAPCTITLTPQSGPAATVKLDGSATSQLWQWAGGAAPRGAVYVQPAPANAGLMRVTIALAPTATPGLPGRSAPAGTYRVTVANRGKRGATMDVAVDVQRDDTPSGYPIYGRQSFIDDAQMGARDRVTQSYTRPRARSAVTRRGTLSAFTTGASDNMFVIGGAHADDTRFGRDSTTARQPARYTSSGGNGRDPDLAYVSEEGRMLEGVLAAGTFSGGAATLSGTSAAAPQATRAVVDVLTATPQVSKAQIIDQILRPDPVSSSRRRLGAGVAASAPSTAGRVPRKRS